MTKFFSPFFACIVCALSTTAQDNSEQLTQLILKKDSLFWHAYNTCDTKASAAFFSDDVEFYHDKGGITLGLTNLVQSLKDGLCKQPDEFRLRREAVPGTVHVFPLSKNDVFYGAVISGEHYFYINQKGKPEYRDGWAKFTHLWLKQNVEWKMTRILSYDHRPAPNGKIAIGLPQSVLQTYAGKYTGKQSGTLQVDAGQGVLVLTNKGKTFTIYPEKQNIFFMKEREITFEFSQNKMTVKEHGAVAEELVKE
ncbi:MAG: nuclear transport factor 2 family protein [Chitinophaga sp.]